MDVPGAILVSMLEELDIGGGSALPTRLVASWMTMVQLIEDKNDVLGSLGT